MKQKIKFIGRPALKNAMKFAFNVLFAYMYQIIFGADNILAGVAICVGLTTLPDMDLGIRPAPMAGIITALYIGSGIAAQFVYAPVPVSLIVYFIFTLTILLLSLEPADHKPSISFLLCFVFCQANPVPPERVPMRLLALAAGGLLTAAVTVMKWRKNGIDSRSRSLIQQIRLCSGKRGYLLRMSVGLSLSMLAGPLLGLPRPMWISIVVMSLTQLRFEDTKQRIMYRSMATVLGASVFLGIMIAFIPRQYYIIFILLIGYLSFFTSKYQYTQIVNAINALNASLYVLAPSDAIVNRVFCLAAGIAITLTMWGASRLYRRTSASLISSFMRKKRLAITVQSVTGNTTGVTATHGPY